MEACKHARARDDVMAVGQSLGWAQEKEMMINRYGVAE
jgi:hypothetical protein